MNLSALLVLGLMAPLSPPADPARALIEAARKQVGVSVLYDSAYVRLAYPGGDVPLERGVCADVIVRAYRRLGVDLQVLVHEDMLAAWTEYPKRWGLSHPDANIDHRRVPNLATFFSRHGKVLQASRKLADYAPGNIVTWRLPGGLPHIGIVSDRRSESGVPLVIHNVGEGAREEDVLFAYTVTGHYRYRQGSVVQPPQEVPSVPTRRSER